MDYWNDKRVITGWALIAGVILAIIVAAVLGATLADRQDTIRNWQDNVALVECAKTPKTATECRVLIYGNR
jgi:hypothetical protein